ncbi:MAG: hypothetical protein C7B47_09685 [Sulfobacillus thermosulfidooxidans]|uniref:Uncharacterized protein n=1 Tax=Sulfobacillus thermosulfidooxidans TaxID=28034 RepID=A0A2T2WX99_SULTH|nr:MAG: hypothetical protein C7B47_09685 [Sulfobacillus thermosulfidooxidans]
MPARLLVCLQKGWGGCILLRRTGPWVSDLNWGVTPLDEFENKATTLHEQLSRNVAFLDDGQQLGVPLSDVY